jgi:membrane-bound inhibitor of C-type lysozyme
LIGTAAKEERFLLPRQIAGGSQVRIYLPILLLAGCSQPSQVNNTAIDINAAAERAKSDIATYASNDGTPANSLHTNSDTAATDAPLTPAEPGQAGGLPDDKIPIAEGPIAADSAQGAANVVQTYYALLESGKYRQAWALWANGGADSKVSAAAFAAGFTKYREYHANIGAPGTVDAGAGQRYVTVPVQVYARLANGKPEYQRGSVVLHRTGDIDGATAEQKAWRIQSIDLKPTPGASGAASTPALANARYRCMDGTKITVRFDNVRDTAAVSRDGKLLATLSGQKPASGIWYKKGEFELRGKGDDATFSTPGQPPNPCTVIR